MEEERIDCEIGYGAAQRTGSVQAGSGTHHLPSSGTVQVLGKIPCLSGLICNVEDELEGMFEYRRGGLEKLDFQVLQT